MSNRGLTYEQVLQLGPDAIRELYPFGAKEWKKRWIPVLEGEEADRPLKRLLKDKKATIEKPLYLKRSYSRSNYTHVKSEALGTDKHGQGAPEESIPKEDLDRFSREARERHSAVHGEEEQRAAIRSCMAQLRRMAIDEVKAGRDPVPVFLSFVAQMEAQERKAA